MKYLSVLQAIDMRFFSLARSHISKTPFKIVLEQSRTTQGYLTKKKKKSFTGIQKCLGFLSLFFHVSNC